MVLDVSLFACNTDFEDCVNNVYCAIRAVRAFVGRNLRDCDFDQQLTCTDFALIHKTGSPDECVNNWPRKTKYWQDFRTCAQSLDLI